MFVLPAFIALGTVSASGATLRAADVAVAFQPGGGCDVAMTFVIESPEPVRVVHRLIPAEGTAVRALTIGGVTAEPQPDSDRAVVVPVPIRSSDPISVRYRVVPAARPVDRCPLLVPDAPTAGISRVVTIAVTLENGGQPLPGQFPAFSWDSSGGRVTLGHLPAFVRVPNAPPGRPLGWRDTLDVSPIVDVAALVLLSGATALWMARQRRRA
jgi:hypothetical protein